MQIMPTLPNNYDIYLKNQKLAPSFWGKCSTLNQLNHGSCIVLSSWAKKVPIVNISYCNIFGPTQDLKYDRMFGWVWYHTSLEKSVWYYMYDTICHWQIYGKSGSMIQYVWYNIYYSFKILIGYPSRNAQFFFDFLATLKKSLLVISWRRLDVHRLG